MNDTHVLVADIVADQVFEVNAETGVVTWLWDAQADFPVEGGGPSPEDWAHINDVTLLEDGRVMVSLRNQDQVVFLSRSTGLTGDWTLGADDRHGVLHEQHNPDYIPEERGGPAVLVADSENGRLVEYRRVGPAGEPTADPGGKGEHTWQWRDDRLQWPRDADRLPGGNTLVADTHGKRAIEVAPTAASAGRCRWSTPTTPSGSAPATRARPARVPPDSVSSPGATRPAAGAGPAPVRPRGPGGRVPAVAVGQRRHLRGPGLDGPAAVPRRRRRTVRRADVARVGTRVAATGPRSVGVRWPLYRK